MSEDRADIHMLSGAYALDALDTEQAEAFERHLDSCPDCRAEVESFTSAVSHLADDSTEAPPARLRDSVLTSITQVRPLPPLVPSDPSGDIVSDNPTAVATLEARRARRLTTWLAVAAAVLAVATVGAVWRATSLQGEVSQLTATAAELNAVLTAPDARTIAQGDATTRATLVVSASEGAAVLLTQGLVAPQGSTYQVWFVSAAGEASSAGFVPSTSGTPTVLVGDPTQAAAVGVTLEPAGGSPQPTTDPVIVMELPTSV